jgi:hypothetical protein
MLFGTIVGSLADKQYVVVLPPLQFHCIPCPNQCLPST